MRSTLSLISTIDSYTLHPLAKLVGWGAQTLVNKSLSNTPIDKPLSKFWVNTILTYTQKSAAPDNDDEAPVGKITHVKNWWASISLVQRVHAFVFGKSFITQQCEETVQKIAAIAKDCIKLYPDPSEEITRQDSFRLDLNDLLLDKSQKLDAGSLTWSQFVGFSVGYASELVSPFIMRWSTLAFTRGFVGSFITTDYSYNPFSWTTLLGTCLLSGASYWFAPTTAPKAATRAIPTRTIRLIDKETIKKIANKAAVAFFGSAVGVSDEQTGMLNELKGRIAELTRKPVVKKDKPKPQMELGNNSATEEAPEQPEGREDSTPPEEQPDQEAVTATAERTAADPVPEHQAPKPGSSSKQAEKVTAVPAPVLLKASTPKAQTSSRKPNPPTPDTVVHPRGRLIRRQRVITYAALQGDHNLIETLFQEIKNEVEIQKEGARNEYLKSYLDKVGKYIGLAAQDREIELGKKLFQLMGKLEKLFEELEIVEYAPENFTSQVPQQMITDMPEDKPSVRTGTVLIDFKREREKRVPARLDNSQIKEGPLHERKLRLGEDSPSRHSTTNSVATAAKL